MSYVFILCFCSGNTGPGDWTSDDDDDDDADNEEDDDDEEEGGAIDTDMTEAEATFDLATKILTIDLKLISPKFPSVRGISIDVIVPG